MLFQNGDNTPCQIRQIATVPRLHVQTQFRFIARWPQAEPPPLIAVVLHKFQIGSREFRRIIKDFEGDDSKNLEAYTRTDSPEYKRMVDEIARRLNLDSLRFSKLETLVKAIGLPKERICTHCFDGSSFYTLEEENT